MSKSKRILGTLLAFGLSLTAVAQEYTVVRDDYSQLQIHINTAIPIVGETTVDGITYSTLNLNGYLPSTEVGAPCRPTFSGLIEVPFCEGYEVEITDAVYDTLAPLKHFLLPSQPSRSKSDTVSHPLILNVRQYSTDEYCGGGIKVETAGTARDRRLAHLKYCPVQYNPVSGTVVVCRSATVTIRYLKADSVATEEHFRRYHSPSFASGAMSLNSLYPKEVSTAAPVRYLIVAHYMFRGQLDNFVTWKRRKGFITDIVYTDDVAVGSDTTSIAAYIHSQYTDATATSPAPTYLLLVGDVEQIPPFAGRTDDDHITDLYYTTWTTGDNLPDCYCGRFSAQTIGQLTPQIDKTLMYEQYTFYDPSFLDRAVMVAGVDGGNPGDLGYTHADPAMDYAIINYINGDHGFSSVRYFKNDPSIIHAGATNVYVASSDGSMSATVRNYYNQGASIINYSAHGSATSWGTPNFTSTHANSMTNTQKFGIMIGNCCLTNKFETYSCLGEAVLRKGNYCGAVGYIGGSNSTYWGEDFYWAVGVRGTIGVDMSMAYNANNLGIYDRLCHTHGEANPQWATSQGSLMMWGNMAVESSTSSLKHYYWEIYHLMGDPSLMPYLTQADTMTITAAESIPFSTTDYSIHAAPYAYVALTDICSHAVVAAAYTNAAGNATLTLPDSLPIGTYELAFSAQQYQTRIMTVNVVQPNGAFPVLLSAQPTSALDAGTSVPVSITVANTGTDTAYGVSLSLSLSDTLSLIVTPSVLTIDTLPAGDTLTLTAILSVSPLADDATEVMLGSSITWSDSSQTSLRNLLFTLNAPVLSVNLATVPRLITAGGTATFTLPLTNSGHATLSSGRMTLTSPTAMFTIGSGVSATSSPFTLAPGTSVTRTFTVHADSLLPDGIDIPLTLSVEGKYVATLIFYIGDRDCETFEGNSFHTSGWTQNALPWTITNEKAYQGTYSLRSASGMDDRQTSEVMITVDLPVADTISFRYSVSSEANYDKFHFYLDSEDLLTSSGVVDWTYYTTNVPAGVHTLHFAYIKDYSVSSNSDCAWIDNVMLPADGTVVNFQFYDICEGATYLIDGDTVNTEQAGRGSRVITGADSSVTIVDYQIHSTSDTTLEVTACDNYSFLDSLYTTSDSLVFTLADSYGCDSTVTLLLTINLSANVTIVDTLAGTSYQWNDSVYTQSGQYVQHFLTAAGCDSTVTLLLTLTDGGTDGIVSTETPTVSVYPNPTTGMVFLSAKALEIEIYDVAGRLVKRSRNTAIVDCGTFPAGTYTLRLRTATGTASCRIVRR